MDWKYEEGRIYSEGEKGELMAEATYACYSNGDINIEHTYVNPSLRGMGVADEMMKVVAEYVRNKNIKAVATCSYAVKWFDKNEKEYEDIISHDKDGLEVGCKVDGRH